MINDKLFVFIFISEFFMFNLFIFINIKIPIVPLILYLIIFSLLLHDFIVIILIDSSIFTFNNLINFSFIYFIAPIEYNLYNLNVNIYLDNDYSSIMQVFSQIIMISFIFNFDIFLMLIDIFIKF